MAIILQSQPSEYGLAYNNNAWVIRTTNYTSTVRFKISVLGVASPYTVIGQASVYPTRSEDANGNVYLDRAFFDPSRWLQSYVESQIAIPSANSLGFNVANKIHEEYRIIVQEEEKNASGVYVLGDIFISEAKSVWNGVEDLTDWLDFDYTDYTVNTFSVTKKFLTDSPRTLDINTGQSAFLYFIVDLVDSADRYTIKTYSEYNGGGSLLSTAYVSNPINDYGGAWNLRYGYIPVGTHDIESVNSALMTGSTPSTIFNGVKSYTIQLRDSTNAQVSELFTYNIDQVCTKYTPVRLHWLNSLGGFDAFSFNLKSIEEDTIKKESYVKQYNTFNGSTYTYAKDARGTVGYDIRKTKKLTINTDFLTDEQSEWMLDLVSSPVVYLEQNNELIAVTCQERKFKKQTSLNDKLPQYTFDIEYALTNQRQRG